MRFEISMGEERSFSVEVPEGKATSIFNRIAAQLSAESKKAAFKKKSDLQDNSENENHKYGRYSAYKGFLYLKCEKCGSVKGFHSKKPIEGYHCFSCGTDNPFNERLVSVFVKCECGESFHYKTNMKEDVFDMNCLACGSPVAVKWNGKKEVYDTIR